MQFIRVFATLLAFAAASTLAGPIPVNSLSKKDAVAKYNILVREPEAETPDSKLEILAREPEVVEARDPSPGGCFFGGHRTSGCI